jgi:hypothetical protein
MVLSMPTGLRKVALHLSAIFWGASQDFTALGGCGRVTRFHNRREMPSFAELPYIDDNKYLADDAKDG